MKDFSTFLSENIEVLTIAITIVIAIAGWIFALWLQGRNIKEQHRVQIRYDIYKQLVQLHKEAQNYIGKLGASSNPPFILMESCMIPFELKLKKEYKGHWSPYTEQDCIFEGERKWTTYIQEVLQHYSDFSNKYLELLYVTEDWESAITPLLKAKKDLDKEVNLLKRDIHKHLSSLQTYTSSHGHDWRKWDKNEVNAITQEVNEKALTIGSYLNDFMVLVHNELLSSYFGHSREIRKTLDPKFKVLTKEGVVENLDTELIQKTENWLSVIISAVQSDLSGDKKRQTNLSESELKILQNKKCHICNAPIIVLETETTKNSVKYNFACGDSVEIDNKTI